MILVDFSVWIDYFSGNDSAEADFLDRTLGHRAVAIGDLILAEVLQGFRHEKDYRIAKRMLEELTVFELLGKDMAIKSAAALPETAQERNYGSKDGRRNDRFVLYRAYPSVTVFG
ncbi:MAG: hypothetical protein U5K99_06250 [Anaerolineales bacterium]|nr:hypothetical protein [Anaerolineales bacterium]